MKRFSLGKNLAAMSLVWVMLAAPMAALAQTKIKMPRNKYKVQDDVKIGQQYSAKVEQQLPILNDAEAARYIQDVGNRLVRAIPREFQQPAFRYSFKIVNARDINAFALPGVPMYVNRGLIEVAKNEGELAGVMAHEISHGALRHGTAQATKQGSLGTQLGQLGMILGGAILGGQAGAQLGMMGAMAWQTKYSRQYETQSDILGARIMANAGYDPVDLANMFKTIAAQSKGGRPPEWLSSHPDPQKRYNNIVNERRMLRVSSNPIKVTRGFARIKEKLRAMPRALSMKEIEARAKNNPNAGNTQANSEISRGRYSRNVPLPSSRSRAYNGGNLFRINIPSNWRQFPSQESIMFAPEGAYGNKGITHGGMVGVQASQQRTLEGAVEEYINGVLQVNSYLRRTSNYSRFNLSGRKAYAVRLAGRSPVTGTTEYALIYMTRLRDGRLFYVVGVAPQRDQYRYNSAFNRMVRSVQINRQA